MMPGPPPSSAPAPGSHHGSGGHGQPRAACRHATKRWHVPWGQAAPRRQRDTGSRRRVSWSSPRCPRPPSPAPGASALPVAAVTELRWAPVRPGLASPGAWQPAGERRGQTALARVPAQRRGEGQRCTRRLPQPRCRAGEQPAAGEGCERQDGGLLAPTPHPAGQQSTGGCCLGRGRGEYHGEGGSRGEMSSVAALDSLAASLPPAAVPKPSASPPTPPPPASATSLPQVTPTEIPEQQDRHEHRAPNNPAAAGVGAQHPAGHPAPPELRGALQSPAGYEWGPPAAGFGVTPPRPPAERFGKRTRMHRGCYDNASGGREGSADISKKPPKKEAEHATPAGLHHGASPRHRARTTSARQPRLLSPATASVTRPSPKPVSCRYGYASGSGSGELRQHQCPLQGCSRCSSAGTSGLCQEGSGKQPGMGTMSPARAGDGPT